MARAIPNTAISDDFGSWAVNLTSLDPNLTVLFGAENLRAEMGASSIVVVPTRDRFDGATINNAQPTTIPKVIRQCWSGFDIHIWGNPSMVAQSDGHDMWDDTYAIRSEVVQAFQDTVGAGNWRVTGGEWLSKGEDDGGEGEELMQYGRWYVLHIELYNPCVRSTPTTAVVQQFPLTLVENSPTSNLG